MTVIAALSDCDVLREVPLTSGDTKEPHGLRSVPIGAGTGLITPLGFAALAAATPTERLDQTMGSAELGRELGDAGGPLLVAYVHRAPNAGAKARAALRNMYDAAAQCEVEYLCNTIIFRPETHWSQRSSWITSTSRTASGQSGSPLP